MASIDDDTTPKRLQQQAELSEALENLDAALKKLPKSLSNGTQAGVIYKSFHDLEKSIIPTEGPYQLLNRAFDFIIGSHRPEKERAKIFLRGNNGKNDNCGLKYFENTTLWEVQIPVRAKILLKHLFEVYSHDSKGSDAEEEITEVSSLIFAQAIASQGPSAPHTQAMGELILYFSGQYPYANGDTGALPWWKAHAPLFLVLSQIAQDILAIPGVSISVERLFASSKHTMTDQCSSMEATSASMAVVCKELLKQGLGDNLHHLTGVSIH